MIGAANVAAKHHYHCYLSRSSFLFANALTYALHIGLAFISGLSETDSLVRVDIFF